MTAMFPDSGVPATDAKNSLPDAAVNSVNCTELWYSTSRCQPRFDPAAANAMLAEIINVIMRAEMTYNCNLLDQLETAVRYIKQRGLPIFSVLTTDAPNLYEAHLDPPATRYNNGMILCVVPQMDNGSTAYINVDGLGWVNVVHADGHQLAARDMRANVPITVCYYNGLFYLQGTGIALSDIPVVGDLPHILQADLDVWVRTDGNDTTGDGTTNTPERAFRTINGAWAKVGKLFIPSPLFSINIRLGIPGDYEACGFSDYGGKLWVLGDMSANGSPARAGYRIITSQDATPAAPNSACATCGKMNSLSFRGVTFVLKGYPEASGVGMVAVHTNSSNCWVQDCNYSIEADNPRSRLFWVQAGVCVEYGTINIFGNGNRLSSYLANEGGVFSSAVNIPHSTVLNFYNTLFGGHVFETTSLGLSALPGTDITASGLTGVSYIVSLNSVFEGWGATLPGSPGVTMTGGIFVP